VGFIHTSVPRTSHPQCEHALRNRAFDTSPFAVLLTPLVGMLLLFAFLYSFEDTFFVERQGAPGMLGAFVFHWTGFAFDPLELHTGQLVVAAVVMLFLKSDMYSVS